MEGSGVLEVGSVDTPQPLPSHPLGEREGGGRGRCWVSKMMLQPTPSSEMCSRARLCVERPVELCMSGAARCCRRLVEGRGWVVVSHSKHNGVGSGAQHRSLAKGRAHSPESGRRRSAVGWGEAAGAEAGSLPSVLGLE